MAPLRWSRRQRPEATGTPPPPAEVRPNVAVVTDSTAYLPRALVDQHAITVVPLQVVVGGEAHSEGEDITSDEVAAALKRWTPVSTSRPSPARFLQEFERLADQGATEIVAAHLSADMSGTYDACRLAARDSPVPVHVIDSRSLGMGLGYAVLDAAAAAREGADGATVADAARARADGARIFFYVDTLEHLRRGGRIGAAQAFIGSALAVKPLLQVSGGRIEPLEKVRTSARALARLEELAVSAVPGAAEGVVPVDVTVHHLASPVRAEQLATRLRARLGGSQPDRIGSAGVPTVEIGAVVGAHVGPGTLAVVVSPVVRTVDRDATDRDAVDRDATDRDATDRDATDRDATDRDAADRRTSPPQAT